MHVECCLVLTPAPPPGPSPHRQVTKMLMECRDELKYSARAIVLLIGIQVVDMKDLDLHLAKAIESGRNLIALSCSIKLINALMVAERSERPLTDVRQLQSCARRGGRCVICPSLPLPLPPCAG